MKKTAKNYLEMFWTWFLIGLCTFGGGYAMIAIIQNKLVEKKKWISNEELSKIIAIAESTPGPIAINSATYVGYNMLGVFGSVLATFGVVLPSFIIIFIISLFFDNFLQYEIVANAFKGIKASVAALILLAGIKIFKSAKKDLISILIFVISLLLTLLVGIFDWNFSSLILIATGAIIGIFSVLLTKNKQISKDQNKENIDKETTITQKEEETK